MDELPDELSIFTPSARQKLEQRLAALTAGQARRWGKMNVEQMLTHCALAFELPMQDPARKQALIGRLLSPFVRRKWLDTSPFSRNSPTDPAFVVSDERDFAAELERLKRALARFVERGPEQASASVHSFFGRLTGAEWGRLMYKHLDHHLRQFGA